MPSDNVTILMIVPTLSAGGSERITAFLANNLNHARFRIFLCVMDATDNFYTVNAENVTLIDLKTQRARYAVYKIYKVIKEIKPDIVFSTLGHLNILVAILKSFLPREIKFVARESVIPSLGNKNSWSPWLFNFLTRKFYKKFHLVICQSQYMQMDLVRNFKIPVNKTIVINNPVTVFRNDPGPNPPARDAYKFLSVGRLAREKGFDRILKALMPVQHKFHYDIVGSGPELNSLIALARQYGLEEKVTFHGNIQNPFDKFGNADVFLMGSRYEGFPNVLLEAGIYKIPTVAFDSPGGIAEIIVNNFNGFLVPDNDLEGYTIAIQKALTYNFDRDKFAEHISTTFDARVIVSQYEKTFEDLLVLQP
jgi:glycosyltransferase involved in cell wall biosynthesis